jgi:hypothetical protein
MLLTWLKIMYERFLFLFSLDVCHLRTKVFGAECGVATNVPLGFTGFPWRRGNTEKGGCARQIFVRGVFVSMKLDTNVSNVSSGFKMPLLLQP